MTSIYIDLAQNNSLLPDPNVRFYPTPIRKLTEGEIEDLIDTGNIDSLDEDILDAYNEYIVPFAEHITELLQPLWEKTQQEPFNIQHATQDILQYITETNTQDPKLDAIQATNPHPVHTYISPLEFNPETQNEIRKVLKVHELDDISVAINGILELTYAYGYPEQAIFNSPTITVYTEEGNIHSTETQEQLETHWDNVKPGLAPQQSPIKTGTVISTTSKNN